MCINFLIERFSEEPDYIAIITDGNEFSYRDLSTSIEEAIRFTSSNIPQGEVVSLKADFTLQSISYFIALIFNNNIIVPISNAVTSIQKFYKIAQVKYEIDLLGNNNKVKIKYYNGLNSDSKHPLLKYLNNLNHPGLILFSSGSTGESKAAVHDLIPLMEKFQVRRPALRTLTFLLFDHIGGFNTLFHILSNNGTIITTTDRSPDNISKLIEKYKIELLPTSPTFINLMILSRVYEKYDLSSLQLVTYGTEPMPEYVLKKFHDILPKVKLKQTYGLSELGILRSKSKADNSLWVKIGGEGYETKIVEDILYIKAKSAMLGYLNAPNPFDNDGWFNTQDKVEVDGEWIKILGRVSDIINVGGQKVYPAEVESVLQSMDNVINVSVYGQSNSIMGSVVAAKVCLNSNETALEFKKRMREFCKDKLETYKIPSIVEIVDEIKISDRYKKVRG